VDRLASNHLCQQALDALIDPFQAFFSVVNSRGGLAQESHYLAMGASKAFSLCGMLHAIRASLLAMAVASLLRCILGAAFRSHAPELKRSQFEIAGSLFPAAGFRDLICDPFCSWMRGDAKPQNTSPAVPHDQQSIEQAKRDCRCDEHILRSDAVGMIAKERPPALGWRVSSPDHVLGHAGLSNIDAEREVRNMSQRFSLTGWISPF
jgi:hypothetical protein